MTIFGIEVENNPEAKSFFLKTKDRLQEANLVTNPFKGDIRKKSNLYIVYIEPVYVHFTPIIWGICIGSFIIFGYRWVQIPLALIGCLYIFWTRYFFYYFMKKGLKKEGYNGTTKMINIKDIVINEVIKSDREKL